MVQSISFLSLKIFSFANSEKITPVEKDVEILKCLDTPCDGLPFALFSFTRKKMGNSKLASFQEVLES